MDKAKADIKARELEERKLAGVPGKGYKKTGWKTFCQPCWTEWFQDGIDKCTKCGRDTIQFEVSYTLIQQLAQCFYLLTFKHKLRKRSKFGKFPEF